MDESRRALVVDDERNIRLTLVAALEGAGLRVDEAPDAAAALAACDRTHYHVALLDLRLPGMDGMELLRLLRVRSPETRVVVITAHGTVDAAVEAMKLGAADFLEKPFLPQQVRDVVTRALGAGSGPARYDEWLATARKSARERRIGAAETGAARALAADPGRPQAYHLLGALADLRGDRLRAQSYYRAALAIDPTYRPSERNLERAMGDGVTGPLLLGDEDAPASR